MSDRILPLGCKDELYVVSSVGALSGQRSLLLEHARLPHCEPGCSTSDICEDPATIRFVPIPPDAGSAAIHFSWSGRLDSELEDTVVSIRVEEDTADLFTAVVELEVQADRVEVRQGGVSLDGQVDHDFSTLHGFFLQVSFADGTYQVQVAGAGLPAQTTGAVAPCTLAHVVCGEFAPANFAPDKIRLSIQFDPAKSLPPSVSATVRPKYHVDDVRISQTRK